MKPFYILILLNVFYLAAWAISSIGAVPAEQWYRGNYKKLKVGVHWVDVLVLEDPVDRMPSLDGL